MRVVKLVMAPLPLAYIGWLLFFLVRPFDGEGGEPSLVAVFDRVIADGLGPTVVGLGLIALLFCIPVLVRLYQLVAPPAAASRSGCTEAEAPEPAFDPDAALARCLARKAEAVADTASPAPEPARLGAAPRPTFGRKSR